MGHEEVGKSIVRRYRVLETIGRGGLGTVYKAVDTRLNRLVAVKVLDFASDAVAKERLRVEAGALARLNHPNIVQMYDVGENEGLVYLAFEFVDGPTLAQLMADGKPLEWPYAIEVIQQVGAALACAHKIGIVHRDVKPTNIIISKEGRVVLLDFGLAIAPGAPTLTKIGMIMGTSAYMSPEQVLGKPVDARSDVFSLGLVCYELLTGRRPFSADSVAESFRNIVENAPVPPQDITPSVPRVLGEIVMKSLAKEPDQRFQTVDDFLSELAKVGRPDSLELPPALTGPDSDFRVFGAAPKEMPSASSRLPESVAETLSIAPILRRVKWSWLAGVLVMILLGSLAVGMRSFGMASFAVVCGTLTVWLLSRQNQQKTGRIATQAQYSPPVFPPAPRLNQQDDVATATELTPYTPAPATVPVTLTIARELFERYNMLAGQTEELPVEMRRRLEEFDAIWDELISSTRHDS